jgi:predicted nucleotide-binding protein
LVIYGIIRRKLLRKGDVFGMDVSNLIKTCLEELEQGNHNLVRVLNKVLRIASLIKDYEAIYAIKLELSSIDDKENRKEIRTEFSNSMMKKFNNWELVKSIHTKIIEQYIERRSVLVLTDDYQIADEKRVKGDSLSEILHEIELLEIGLSKNTLPDGLHSLDLYYESRRKQKEDTILLHNITQLKNIVSRVENFIYDYLIRLESQGAAEGVLGMNSNSTSKNIFIIHGHNEAKWRELYKILKEDFDLNPIVLGEQPDRGCSTIIEKFEYYAKACSYAFAIFTPDDVVEKNGQKYFQARPNVIYELGWFSAYLGRERVCLLLQEGENMEIFSDFQGVLQKRFRNSIIEQYKSIKQDLEYVGLLEG